VVQGEKIRLGKKRKERETMVDSETYIGDRRERAITERRRAQPRDL